MHLSLDHKAKTATIPFQDTRFNDCNSVKKVKESQETKLINFSDEILLNIFKYLDLNSSKRASESCRSLNKIKVYKEKLILKNEKQLAQILVEKYTDPYNLFEHLLTVSNAEELLNILEYLDLDALREASKAWQSSNKIRIYKKKLQLKNGKQLDQTLVTKYIDQYQLLEHLSENPLDQNILKHNLNNIIKYSTINNKLLYKALINKNYKLSKFLLNLFDLNLDLASGYNKKLFFLAIENNDAEMVKSFLKRGGRDFILTLFKNKPHEGPEDLIEDNFDSWSDDELLNISDIKDAAIRKLILSMPRYR